MEDLKFTRTPNALVISSPNGTAEIRRTPQNNNLPSARPWMLSFNGTLHETYDIEEKAIEASREILALKP
jgi:hypothetical protein